LCALASGRLVAAGGAVVLATATFCLYGCVQTADSYSRPILPAPAVPAPKIATQSETIGLEAADRIARFRRLAAQMGVLPPEVAEAYAPPGSVPGVNAPIPVVRLVFDERVFFDFDNAAPRPESMSVIEVVAANMKRDVPDAALTILGHTDAIGTDAYNTELSQRRASTVLGELIERGLDPNQLSTVAIGKSQPIAPNSTEEGRARNRRVEFLISGSEQANLSVVQDRPVNAAFLTVMPHQAPPPLTAVPAQVLKPIRRPAGPGDEGILGPTGMLTLRPPEAGPSPIAPAAPPQIVPAASTSLPVPGPVTPPPSVTPREPEPVLPAPLRDPSPLNF
jgi:outer membrane protein OmpA-like peptidoglycan-associated protein